MPGESKPRKRSTRRTLVIVGSTLLLGLVAALTLAGGVAYWMARQAPEHWLAGQRALASIDEQRRAEMARALERRTGARLSSAGPVTAAPEDEPDAQLRTLHFEFDEVNAWLDQRLADWLANQGHALPEGLEQPMLMAEDGDLLLAFRVSTPRGEQIVSIVFNVEVVKPGRARLVVHRVLAGRLPVPMSTLIEQAARQGEQGETEVGAHRVLRGEVFEAVIPIDRQRDGRLLDVEVTEAGVDVTLLVANGDG